MHSPSISVSMSVIIVNIMGTVVAHVSEAPALDKQFPPLAAKLPTWYSTLIPHCITSQRYQVKVPTVCQGILFAELIKSLLAYNPVPIAFQ